MANRTLLNPSIQISASTAYTPRDTPGITLQSAALTVEDDLNAIRSQLKRVLDSTLTGNWYDDVATSPTGQKRSIKQLNNGLSAIEAKTIMASASVDTTVTVPAGQNYVILNVANKQAPTQPAAVQLTTLGAVAAQSAASGTAFGAHELAIIAGSNTQAPKNRCVVVDATTKAVIETADYDIFGLLQFEGTGADGTAFNDTVSGARAKLSFVYFNPTTNSVVACPAADIGGKSLRYVYPMRTNFAALSEDAFLNPAYVDAVAAIDVTASRAFANQAGAPIPINADALFRVANGFNFKVQAASGAKDLLSISPSAAGNAATVSSDTLALATTQTVTSLRGITLGTAGQAINVGATVGQIDTTGPLSIKTLGSNALALAAGGAFTLADGYVGSSTWTSSTLALAQNSGDWSAYRAAYGEASLLNAILKAGQMGNHAIFTATVTAASIPAGTTVTGMGPNANISRAFPDTSATPKPSSNTVVYLNGQLQTPNGEDYTLVAGSTATEIAFTFPLRGGATPDRITVEVFQNPAVLAV